MKYYGFNNFCLMDSLITLKSPMEEPPTGYSLPPRKRQSIIVKRTTETINTSQPEIEKTELLPKFRLRSKRSVKIETTLNQYLNYVDSVKSANNQYNKDLKQFFGDYGRQIAQELKRPAPTTHMKFNKIQDSEQSDEGVQEQMRILSSKLENLRKYWENDQRVLRFLRSVSKPEVIHIVEAAFHHNTTKVHLKMEHYNKLKEVNDSITNLLSQCKIQEIGDIKQSILGSIKDLKQHKHPMNAQYSYMMLQNDSRDNMFNKAERIYGTLHFVTNHTRQVNAALKNTISGLNKQID